MPLIRNPVAAHVPPPARELAAVTAALARGDDDERWVAARTLGELAGAAAVLCAALSREGNPRVRGALFTSLARIGTPECVDVALPYLRSDDALVRMQAWDALAAMPTVVAPYLGALLRDRDANVRILACELARNLPGDAALPLFCDLLDSEPEPNVCASAVDVLAEVGGPAALPALERCAERFRSIPFLSFSLGVAIDRIRSQAPRA
jgi:HEAT repeat protein